MNGVYRYELVINGKHYGYYYKEKDLHNAVMNFHLCKPKWYDTYEEYQDALFYRLEADVEIKKEELV